jgi:hypothetical protein
MAYAIPAWALSRSPVNVLAPVSDVFDGIEVAAGQRVLLTGQTTHSENGVWLFAGTRKPMSRPGKGDQYERGNVFDNATLIPVSHGTTYAGTVWGIDPAAVVTVDTDPHTLTRVVLPPVQCRAATEGNVDLTTTILVVDNVTAADGAMNNMTDTTTLTCATSLPFTPADAGKPIVVAGAGPVAPDGAATDLITTIATYVSRSTVILSSACITTVAGAAVSFGGVSVSGDGAAGSDIILVKDQATASQNGFYWANTAGVMLRCSEPLVPGRDAIVSEGESNAHLRFELTTQGAIVPDTTPLNFSLQNREYNLRDFGGVPDWDGITATTDDLPAWNAMMAAIVRSGKSYTGETRATAKIVAHGKFYFGGTLHIEQTVVIQGSGVTGESVGSSIRSDSGTLFVFPANTTGIRIHSTVTNDDGTRRDAFLNQAGTTTTLQGGGNHFTAESVGKTITISGSGTPANNGTFMITGLVDSTSVTWTSPMGSMPDPGSPNGATAKLTQSGIFTTLTGGTGFSAFYNKQDQQIRITGGAGSPNTGVFFIDQVLSDTSLKYVNKTGADEFPVSWGVGSVTYTLGGGHTSGERTALRDLTIYCKDAIDPVTNNSGHGVYATAPIFAENAWAQNFPNHGFYLRGNEVGELDESDGSVDETVLYTCITGMCGIDGFHIIGGDANGGAFVGCQAKVNRRYGFYDATRMNAYIGCHSEGNGAPGLPPPLGNGGDGIGDTGGGHGAEYHVPPLTSNTSTFVGCYAEGSGPHSSQFRTPVTIIGGTLGNDNITDDSVCFVLDEGIAAHAPYKYSNARGSTRVTFSAGSCDPAFPENMDAFVWETPDAPNVDYSLLRYTDNTLSQFHRWWTLWNSDVNYRAVMRFPTIQTGARRPAPWFPNGFFLGLEGSVPGNGMAFTAAPSLLEFQANNTPQSYDVGDVVWQSTPVPGSALGLVCVAGGILNPGTTTTSNITPASVMFTVASAAGMIIGQVITIGGVPGYKTITNIAGTTITIDTAANATVGPGAPVSFGATFAIIGQVPRSSWGIGPTAVSITPTGSGELGLDLTGLANYDVTASDDSYARVVTSNVGAGATVTFPSPPADAAGYARLVKNNGAAALTVQATSGAGTVGVAVGQMRLVWISNSAGAEVAT